MIYFKEEEFIMGGENVFDKMDTAFLLKLDLLRGKVGFPLSITSSYRSIEYNKTIHGAPRSMHLKGRAVDLHCKDAIKRAKIVKEALFYGLSVGASNNFVHVDNRETQMLFCYD